MNIGDLNISHPANPLTGAISQASGSPGNFDHVPWVTMTEEGEVVANITLDGIFEKPGGFDV